jgi:hypothetical protein
MFHHAKTVAVTVAIVVLLVIGWRFALALVGIAAALYLNKKWKRWRAIARFRREWHPQGKDLLLVYSRSPHWQRYVEEHWLPNWGQRAVVLNWSERKAWAKSSTSAAALFRAFAGQREFNPLAIVVPPRGPVHTVRFWRAFRDFKHGKDQPLRQAETELASVLELSGLGGMHQ